jgi:hypothetical protein
MTNPPTTSLPPGRPRGWPCLLDALDGVVISDAERSSLTWWWAGSEAATLAPRVPRIRRGDAGLPGRAWAPVARDFAELAGTVRRAARGTSCEFPAAGSSELTRKVAAPTGTGGGRSLDRVSRTRRHGSPW